MSEELRNPRIHPRRIIERPRLIQELELSGARIVLLVAGAGFGKTVFSEQWGVSSGRAVGWFRAGGTASDVAVVVRQIASAAERVLPGASRRVLDRLAVTDDPEREATLLAELLAEDLVAWPVNGWLVIDDYQFVGDSPAAEIFIATILARSSIQVVIASRARPGWVAAAAPELRNVLELGEETLAMTADEVDGVLRFSSNRSQSIDEGWPALVSLAAMLPDSKAPGMRSARVQYEVLADELVAALDPGVRDALMMLASLPSVDREMAEAVLGAKRGREACRAALELGLLDERGGFLEFAKPLADHLEGTFRLASRRDVTTVTKRALESYRRRRQWDQAFELVRRHELDDDLAGLVLEAVDEFLSCGRLSTLLSWVHFARSRRLHPHPVLLIAEMEAQLRLGRHATALTTAQSLLTDGAHGSDVLYRVRMVAARAAHAGNLDEEALEHYRTARTLASTSAKERDARWGELMCMSALEHPDAPLLLEELAGSVDISDPRDQVRTAERHLSVGFRLGYVKRLSDSRRAAELVDSVDDPFVRGSFLTMHAWALALGAYYEEALSTAEKLLKHTIELRVDPVLPYAYLTQAVALAGLDFHDRAHRSIDLADLAARRINDENGVQSVYAVRVRLLLQDRAASEGCAIEPPDVSTALPSVKGEVLASRGLALATLGRLDEATDLADEAGRTTTGIEAQALRMAVAAVCSLKERRDDVFGRCDALIEHVFAAGAVDIAVTAYRSNPELLGALLASGRTRDKVAYLLKRAGDEDRAAAAGILPSAFVDPAASLSEREREVYALVCEGLSNAQIAKLLFISPSTVKVHVHHMFDKLGIRSRTALALNAAYDRYATSTAASTGDDSGSVGSTMIPNPGPLADR